MAVPFMVSMTRASKLLRFDRLLYRFVSKELQFSTENAVVEAGEPQYPKIPPPKDCNEELIRIASEPVIAAETPAEMIYALNKRYTWNYKIHPFGLHTGFIDFYKHITKTEVVNGLPEQMCARIDSEEVQTQTQNLDELVQNIILHDTTITYRHKQDAVHKDRDVGRQMCKNLMSNLVAQLSPSNPHLMDADMDFDVEMKSFWQRGSHKFYQYLGEPLVTVRTREPLKEFTGQDSELSIGSVPDWPYDPNIISVFKKCENAMCFPGFKHGGGHLHAHTQLYVAEYNRTRTGNDLLLPEVLEGHGISSSFAWLNALALYQKYCCYIDIPRPQTCQTIVTDGRFFSFYCYQLNTLTLDDLKGEGHDIRNVCWQAVDMPLYSTVEENQVQGFNKEVLTMLIAFLTNPVGHHE